MTIRNILEKFIADLMANCGTLCDFSDEYENDDQDRLDRAEGGS